MREIYTYLLTVPVFFAIDMVWIGVIAKNLYFKTIPGLREQPNWPAAIIFYLIYIAGILYFVVYPNRADLGKTIINGAMLGFLAYATYDLTNYAVMKNWPLNITLIDLAWGTFLTAAVAGVGYYILRWIY